MSLDDARSKIERWRIEYNRERPHASLEYPTPEECAAGVDNQGSSADARQPRIQNLTVLRPPSNSEERPKNCAKKRPKREADTNSSAG